MRNNMFKKGLVLALIFLFMVSVITPISIGYNIRISDDKIITKEELKQSLNAPLDSEWPIYQHDAAHTGYSQAQFPNSFKKIWFKSYQKDLNTSMISPFASPVTSNGKIFITGDIPSTQNDSGYGVVCALNQSNGSLIWKKDIPLNGADNGFYGFHSPAVYGGKIFTVLGCFFTFKSKSKIVALDENTGDILWEKTFSGTSYYSSVTVADDKVFVCGHMTFCPTSWLYVFDANNGDLLWQTALIGYSAATPVVFEDKIFVATGRFSGMILISINFRILKMFSGKSRIYAFNIDNGEKIWMKYVKGHLIQCSPVAANGKLFVISNIKILNKWNCRICALDVDTGEEIWHHDMNQEKGFSWPSSISTPSVAYGKVFVTDFNGWLRAWDQNSGELVWEKEIYPDVPDATSVIFTSPIIVDGKVIVGANDGQGIGNNELFMFNESTGQYIWNLKFGGETTGPFIVSNEMLFVNDGFDTFGIYAFG